MPESHRDEGSSVKIEPGQLWRYKGPAWRYIASFDLDQDSEIELWWHVLGVDATTCRAEPSVSFITRFISGHGSKDDKTKRESMVLPDFERIVAERFVLAFGCVDANDRSDPVATGFRLGDLIAVHGDIMMLVSDLCNCNDSFDHYHFSPSIVHEMKRYSSLYADLAMHRDAVLMSEAA